MFVGEHETGKRTRAAARQPVAAKRGLATPSDVLIALQQAAGNRALGRQLARQPKTADPPKPHVPWAQQTNAANVAIAKDVDEYEKLGPQALADLKDRLLVQVSGVGDPRHKEFERELEALEFLVSQGKVQQRQYIPPPFLDKQTDTRRMVRRNLEGYVRQEGSFHEAVLDLQNWAFQRADNTFDEWSPHIDFIEKEVDAFGDDFKHQAHDMALTMLHDSRNEILFVLKSYGLAPDWAQYHATHIANHKDVDDEVKTLINYEDAWDHPDKRNPSYSARSHRAGLGRLIVGLKEQQDTVKTWRLKAFDKPVDYATTERLLDETHKLERMWARVEKQHPVLTSFRGSGQLADADLGRLDDTVGHEGSKPQMTFMLTNLLPKLGDIITAEWQINHGQLKPLSLPPVVALTKAAMFVPEGSLRWGKVNDMVEAAQDTSVSKKIAEGLLALIVLALVIPSGGSSLGLGIGLVSAALSASSAMEDWQDYKQHKMLANTAMDRAKALSLEEPSLLPFAFDLVSLGIDGAPLLKAFHEAVTMKSLIQAGEGANKQAIKELQDELNKLGKDKHLGDRALEDCRASERDAAAREHEGSGSAKDEPKPKEGETSASKGATAGKVKDVATAESKLQQEIVALHDKIHEPLQNLTHGLSNPNSEWRELSHVDREALIKRYPEDRLVFERLNDAFIMMRDPDRLEAAMLKLKKLAFEDGITPPEALIKYFGGRAGMPIMKGTDPQRFRALLEELKPMIDDFDFDTHGSLTHMFQEYVLAEAWGKDAAREFRRGIARSEGDAIKGKEFYSQVWDALFDSLDEGMINRPEELGPILIEHLGFPGRVRRKP